MDKYENKRTEMYDLVFNLMEICTSNILLNTSDEEQLLQLQTVKKYVESYCNLDREYKSHKSVMDLTRNKYTLESELNTDIWTVYDEIYAKYTPPQVNINNHKFMKQFKKYIDKNVDDFLMSDTFVIPTDPITKNPISNPVKNIHCGHVYESETIKHLIKNKKIKCPYVGCKAVKYITISNLQEDTELKQKIESYK